jgi:hypothetical protein
VKIVAMHKGEQNRAVLDPWTVVHFAAGLALGLVSMPRLPSLGAAVGYELMEQWAERRRLGQELFDVSGPETLHNAVADVIVFAGGYYLGSRWNED